MNLDELESWYEEEKERISNQGMKNIQLGMPLAERDKQLHAMMHELFKKYNKSKLKIIRQEHRAVMAKFKKRRLLRRYTQFTEQYKEEKEHSKVNKEIDKARAKSYMTDRLWPHKKKLEWYKYKARELLNKLFGHSYRWFMWRLRKHLNRLKKAYAKQSERLKKFLRPVTSRLNIAKDFIVGVIKKFSGGKK